MNKTCVEWLVLRRVDANHTFASNRIVFEHVDYFRCIDWIAANRFKITQFVPESKVLYVEQRA